VRFTSSGTEATLMAVRLARAFTGRARLLRFKGHFHGWHDHMTSGYTDHFDGSPTPGVLAGVAEQSVLVAPGDIAAVRAALAGGDIAAAILEPTGSTFGQVPLSPDFLHALRAETERAGALLIFDEVQCGMGRIGRLFAHQHFDVKPDAFTIAKSLANGLPIGTLIVRGEAASSLKPGDHGTTFGGSPVPAAAALEHLKIRDVVDLDAHVTTVGALLRTELAAIAAEMESVFEQPRGIGLMLGLPVREPYAAKDFVTHGLDHGVFLNAAGRNTLRFVPPLIISADEIRDAAVRLRRTIAAALRG
jgi:glutamate-1-semialdehyde 2,1-aminomutase